jgi:hypothetical protein
MILNNCPVCGRSYHRQRREIAGNAERGLSNKAGEIVRPCKVRLMVGERVMPGLKARKLIDPNQRTVPWRAGMFYRKTKKGHMLRGI